MRKTVLVTGGAGYVGSHACKALAQAGYVPIAYDNLVHGHEWAVKWGPLERGDILDSTRLASVLEQYRPIAALHFAGFAYVGESVTDPAKYYRNNVSGTLVLLDALVRAGIDKLVFSSSCSTYGVPASVPIREDHPQNPVNPYGFGKLVVERVLRDYERAYGLRSVSLRYFNAAGADPDGETREDHDPETHLIPLVLQAALGRKPNVVINGADYPTPDGTCIRDYIHVTDLAIAHVLALGYLENGDGSEYINLGTGTGASVKAVVEVARKVTGKIIATEVGLRRAGDPPALVAEAVRARELLGWKPQYAELDVQIQHAWAWLKTHEPRTTNHEPRLG